MPRLLFQLLYFGLQLLLRILDGAEVIYAFLQLCVFDL